MQWNPKKLSLMNWRTIMFTDVCIVRVNAWVAGVDNLDYSGFGAEIAGNVLML